MFIRSVTEIYDVFSSIPKLHQLDDATEYQHFYDNCYYGVFLYANRRKMQAKRSKILSGRLLHGFSIRFLHGYDYGLPRDH